MSFVGKQTFLLYTTKFYVILNLFQFYREQQLICQPLRTSNTWPLPLLIWTKHTALLTESSCKRKWSHDSPAHFCLGAAAHMGHRLTLAVFSSHCSFLRTPALTDLPQCPLNLLQFSSTYLIYYSTVLFIILYWFFLI